MKKGVKIRGVGPFSLDRGGTETKTLIGNEEFPESAVATGVLSPENETKCR